jgi:hypothetical protein
VIPLPTHGAVVWAMEGMLEVDTRPDDPQRPQVGLDETSPPLVAETRVPIPAAPGQPEHRDDEYARQGAETRCLVFEPWVGPRLVQGTERRPASDCAQVIQEVVDEPYLQAAQLILVMAHLHKHKPAPLEEACAPAAARQVTACWEIHDTPKHGSWRQMAKTALSVLATPGLDR